MARRSGPLQIRNYLATAVGGTAMKRTALLALSLSLAGGTLVAQDATVRSLLSKDLAGGPGRELSLITVEYPPGGSSPAHTHHAQALVYVLEGSIVMQVKGGAPVTLAPGQTWDEGPDDVHVVSRNASNSAPAKYLVFLVKDKGAPILTPVK
jgi:quercetin dioxygenase-like cupin family protein